MALFRRNPPAPAPEPEPAPSAARPGAKKDRPTPSRSQAEAARRQRVGQQLTKKEARAYAARQSRAERMKALAARDATPEKALMRDYIDARRNLGEFLLPGVVVILAVSVLGQFWPSVTAISVVVMYAFIFAVLVDGYLMWRGFKRVLAQRLPHASTKGLLMYGMTRATQIRRFRVPPPRIKRGEAY